MGGNKATHDEFNTIPKLKNQTPILHTTPTAPPRHRGVVGPATQLRRRGQWEYLNQQCFIWKFKLNKGIIEMGQGCWVTPIDTFWSRRREMATQITLFIKKRMMLKLTLGECWNQIRYINILHTPSENTFFSSLQSKILSKYLRRFITTPHPPAGQTACSCLSCENMRVGAQLCLQKCENVLFFFFFLIRWPLSVTFLHSMFCSVSIQRFSELGFLTSLQMKISTASVSRSSRPLKGFNFLGAVLSTGEGGKKKGSTLNTLWLKQWKMSSIRFSD